MHVKSVLWGREDDKTCAPYDGTRNKNCKSSYDQLILVRNKCDGELIMFSYETTCISLQAGVIALVVL